MHTPWRNHTPYLRLYRALKLSRDTTALRDVLAHLIRNAGLDREEATKAAILAGVTADLGVTCTCLERHHAGAAFGTLPDATPRATTPHAERERATQSLTRYAAMARSAGGFIPLLAEHITGDAEDDHTSAIALFASVPGSNPRKARTITSLLTHCAGWDYAPTTHLSSLARAGLALLTPAAPTASPETLLNDLVRDTAENLGYPDGEGHDREAVLDTLTSLQRHTAGT
ncbi:hypothetical protein AB0O47_39965, partial [Streptomyces noursei]|uniref:hypothetical protein n=1 Tax=Streptomyces noursei TaxID=1971 RepID=UPI00344B48D5